MGYPEGQGFLVMGIETILFAAFTGISAISKMSAANKQAKQVKRNAEAEAASKKVEGELVSKEKAKQIRNAAARQTSSFLSAGITLDGTPMDVLNETFSTGIDDITNIGNNYNNSINSTISNANAQSKNIMSSARSQVISDIAGSFAGGSFGGDLFGSASFGMKTGGQSLFNGGIDNMVGAASGAYGPGF